jgi:hypothetical protein
VPDDPLHTRRRSGVLRLVCRTTRETIKFHGVASGNSFAWLVNATEGLLCSHVDGDGVVRNDASPVVPARDVCYAGQMQLAYQRVDLRARA